MKKAVLLWRIKMQNLTKLEILRKVERGEITPQEAFLQIKMHSKKGTAVHQEKKRESVQSIKEKVEFLLY